MAIAEEVAFDLVRAFQHGGGFFKFEVPPCAARAMPRFSSESPLKLKDQRASALHGIRKPLACTLIVVELDPTGLNL